MPAPAHGHAHAIDAATRPTPVLPLLGARPLRPSVTVAREIAEPGASSASLSPAATAPGLPGAVPARWSAGADLPATIGRLPADGAGDVVPLRPLDAPEAGSTPAGPAMPGEIVFPARGAAPGTPAASVAIPDMARRATVRTPAASWSTSGSRAAPASSSGGRAPIAQRSMALARPSVAAAAAAAASSPAAVPAASAARSITAAAPTAAPAVTVQTSPASGGGSGLAAGLTTTPVVQRVDGAAPAPAAGDGGGSHSDTELDELAQALFGRIRTHLRLEVIHEREAKGLTFDTF
ncbi:MAG: hypothetical protein WCK58_12335 [Chloroflexota bacterium]